VFNRVVRSKNLAPAANNYGRRRQAMNRVIRREQGVVVEMHDRPCVTTDDYERVKQLLINAGRDAPRLVVDCSRVQWMAASFLSALLIAFKALGARHGDLVLCGLRPLVREVFEVTKLDLVFPIYSTREEALRSAWPEPEMVVVEESNA
jgi:anti-anti-sigma factor